MSVFLREPREVRSVFGRAPERVRIVVYDRRHTTAWRLSRTDRERAPRPRPAAQPRAAHRSSLGSLLASRAHRPCTSPAAPASVGPGYVGTAASSYSWL